MNRTRTVTHCAYRDSIIPSLECSSARKYHGEITVRFAPTKGEISVSVRFPISDGPGSSPHRAMLLGDREGTGLWVRQQRRAVTAGAGVVGVDAQAPPVLARDVELHGLLGRHGAQRATGPVRGQ